MGGFFTAILAKFSALASWFINLFKGVFTALWDLSTDAACWVFEQVCGVIQTVLNGLPGPDAFALLNPGTWLSGISAETTNMLGMMRLGECFAIILGAIAIKLVLQVIPFTRLGS